MPWFVRNQLAHTPPPWVDGVNAVFFITVCCQPRGVNQLANDRIAAAVNEAIAFRSEKGLLFPYALLLMPDHLHAIVGYNEASHSLEAAVSSLKQRLAQQHGIRWQKGFFDHRIRDDRGYKEKVSYILNNPVTAGLCAAPSEWPFVWFGGERG